MHSRPRIILRLSVVATLIGVAAGAASAQSTVVAASDYRPTATAKHEPRVALLDRPAYLDVEDLALPAALVQLRFLAGVPIVFSESILPPGARVSCDCGSATVRQALDSLLAGMDLHYVELRTQVLIEPLTRTAATKSRDWRSMSDVGNLGLLAVKPSAPKSHTTDNAHRLYRQGTVAGTVVDGRTLRPLAGVQVMVVGTSIGTLSNAEGQFLLIGVPEGQNTIRAHMIGYAPLDRTVTVAAGQTVRADFEIVQQAISLDEIVVTGTAGQARRREIGNSIAAVNASEIAAAPVRNVQEIIGGQVAGATVLANSGQPGAGGTIILRGNTSLTQGNMPLVYVDGVRLYSKGGPGGTLPLNDISAEQIERVEVVRGPAATTLYGTEAAGGVIQIFTKRGAAGKPAWTAEVETGVNNLDLTSSPNPTGFFLNSCRGPGLVTSTGQAFEDVTCPASGSWLRNGLIQRYGLSVRGGTSDPLLTYFLSGSYRDVEGVVAPGGSKDGALRGNFTFSPGSDLRLSTNVAYTQRTSRWIPDGNYLRGFLLNVTRGPVGNYRDQGKPANMGILDQRLTNTTDHFILGMTIDHQTRRWLTQRFTVGYDYTATEDENLIPFGHVNLVEGQMTLSQVRHTTLSLDYGASLRHELTDRITSEFSVGGQVFRDYHQARGLSAVEFAGPGDPTLTSAARTSVSGDQRLQVINAGFYLQELVGFNDLFFITAGLRVDGNSAFGRSFGLQPYPKLSASYVISEHDFWPESRAINSVKLRAAFGESGKAPGAFDAVRTWEPVSADDGQPAFTPAQLGNPNLGPERSRELELGFDAILLSDRMNLDFTYFRQTTEDALVPVAPAPSEGFLNRQLQNVGSIGNSGFTAQLDARILNTASLEWSGRLSYSRLKSEAIDLAGELINVGSSRWYNTLKEGYPVPSFFGAVITNPDAIAAPIIADDQYIGPAYPAKTASVGTTITYDRFTLSALGEYNGGHYQQNAMGFQNNIRDVWPPCYEVQEKLRAAAGGDLSAVAGVTARQRAKCALPSDPLSQIADFWIQPADFFKLRNISLSIAVPESWIPTAGTATLTLSGRNLFTITDYDGLDPEVNDFGHGLNRQEYYNLPPARSFMAALRVSF